MSIARTFIDWSSPALPTAADLLIERYSRDGLLDLSNVLIVLPGGRAGRRLLEILVYRAELKSLVLLPPRITTMGALPESLYESKQPFASELVQRLAWVESLRNLRRRAIRFIPRLPDDEDFAGWMDLGTLLWQQHRELAAEGLSFADVAPHGEHVPGFTEGPRWKFLRQVQEKYLTLLDGLGLWDMQTARLFAIEHRLCRTKHDIVLIGTSDMNHAMRSMLDQVADRVTTLIHAPESLADRFDKYGCIDPAAWQSVPIELDDKHLRIVEGPADQADSTVRCIEALGGKFRADQITIGMADQQLVPQMQRQLLQYNLPSRWVVGKAMAETGPFQLLEAVAAYVERGRYADFAALVRHPDVFDWITAQGVTGDWLTQLDEYYNDHLQPRLGQWLAAEKDCAALKSIDDALHKVTQPLRGQQSRRLGEWAPRIAQVLLDFYANTELDRDDANDNYTAEAFRRIHDTLLDHQSTPKSIAPTSTAMQAISLLLDQLRGDDIPPPSNVDAIELLGWLELPLDTAPALIVTSFNEGFVPKSMNSDLFLPNALRRKLRVVDNERRYARDAYALSVLLASREKLTLISARRNSTGDPLVPSRLAFATERKNIAARSKRFFHPAESTPVREPLIGADSPAARHSDIVVHRPAIVEPPVQAMSVTSFRSYLACPFRFYLRHVLKLAALDDEAEELGPAQFGNVIHDVLKQFGRDEIRHSSDADDIRQFLRRAATDYMTRTFGKDRLPAVDVQSMQLRTRLDAFAEWQANWALQGWRIEHAETGGGEEPVRLHLEGGESMTLRGRIDRIDRNEQTGEWAVFDYKTSDAPKTPESEHYRAGQWQDLQLPLYRHFMPSLGITDAVRLGYIVLPKDTSKIGAVIAEWNESQLVDADDVAYDVARRVLAGEFWPPKYPASRLFGEFEAICQDRVFERRLEGSTHAVVNESAAEESE